MEFGIGPHLEETELEQYSMGTLSEKRTKPFEEHFLACEACQNRLLETEAYVNAVRSISPKLRHASGLREIVGRLFPWPGRAFIMAGATVAIALLVTRFWPSRSHPTDQQAVIMLSASRGIDRPVIATAGRPLLLQIDVAQIEGLGSYRLEIVRSQGDPASDGIVVPNGSRVTLALKNGLSFGTYYARLYRPAGELLREYAFEIK